ncbi:MAG TPA: EAL domain-containing protein [Thiotrichales bacterium]|nr:EAL domain-containing protein [Thiotrichales bacterium]
MLLELAALLVGSGLFLLVVGVFVARQYTLRSKLLTAFLIIVLTSLGVQALLDNYIMSENLRQSANKVLITTAKSFAEKIDSFTRENSDYLKTEAALPAIINFIVRKAEPPYNRQAILEILRAFKSRQDDYILSYAILNRDGVNMVDTDPLKQGDDESGEVYYRNVKARHGDDAVYHSSIVFENDRPILIFSSAINDLSGKMVGVLRAKYSANILSTMFERIQRTIGRGSFVMLLDENQLRLVHSRRKDLAYTLAALPAADRLAALKRQRRLPQNVSRDYLESPGWVERLSHVSYENPVIESTYTGLGTSKFLSAVYQLETEPWKIIVSQPLTTILEPVEAQKNSAFVLVSIIALVVVLVVLATTQLLLGPVKRLTNVVKRIAEGDLAAQATVEANDEVGSLAGAFNEMTQSVTNLIVDLEDEINNHKLTADNLRKLSQAIEQSPVSVMITDLDGNIEYVNPQLCRITGYSEEELIGQNPRILKSGHTPEIHFKNMWSAITAGQSWTGELYNKKKNGDLFWENVTISPIKNAHNESTHYLAIKEDISLRKEYEERLLYQASYDKLTDLPNRTLAYDRIQQAIANAVWEQKHIALLYMDFDHFKNINDTLGHEAGDEFLKYMAGRLKASVRDFDTVARLGGDEFLIMLVEVDQPGGGDRTSFTEVVKNKTREILQRVSQPCVIHGMEFSVTASVGIALFPDDGDDPHILLRHADTAMYRSKRKGRNTFELFTTEMSDIVMKRVEIDNKLRGALENGDFYLKYQALMDARTQRIVGAEALIRWEDPELGEVSPEEFVPLAEESGLIVDIGNWVMETACHDIRRWRETAGFEDIYVAINLSTRQFRGKGIVENIAGILAKHGLSGDCLELEITERLLMKDVPHVVAILDQFKAMNIRLSIDDFGTGYSSLSYLKRFPFDVLKIDKAFIDDIGADPDGQALCDAIVAMAHSLGLGIIGEGVETQEQFEFLRDRGAETIQGYYVSKPLEAHEFIQLLGVSELLESNR